MQSDFMRKDQGSDKADCLNIEYGYKKKPFFDFCKRFEDIFIALLGLLITSPLFLIIAIIIKATSKGPIIYRHQRVGRNGKDFYVLKFRTMINDNRSIEEILTKEEYELFLVDLKLPNDPRVTKFGQFLRKTSLDELPQLVNILKGEMSLIGPRPIMRQYELERFGKNADLLLKVRPGLTGYWASHGRNNTSYDERMKMELYYVTKRGFWLDTKIFFKTILAVLSRKGAV